MTNKGEKKQHYITTANKQYLTNKQKLPFCDSVPQCVCDWGSEVNVANCYHSNGPELTIRPNVDDHFL